MDQGSTMKRSAVHNFAPTVTKFCVMWEGQALPHDTKFGNSRCEIIGRRVIFIWSLIHGLRWSGLIKAEPGLLPSIWCSTPRCLKLCKWIVFSYILRPKLLNTIDAWTNSQKFCRGHLIKLSQKFVPKCSINNKSGLVQGMTWCRIGDWWPTWPHLTYVAKYHCNRY